MPRPLAAAILLVLGLVPALRADGPMPETIEGPLPPPYHSFGAVCCQPAARNWWYVPPHAPHLGWQGYCGECNYQMEFGGCPNDYLGHHGCGPIDRLGYGLRGLLFGDDCCDGCDSCGCRDARRVCGCERACGKPACGCERAAPKCGTEPVCGVDESVPPPPPSGENPFHDDPSVPPAPRKLAPPMPPPLESELPQSSLPKPLRSAARAPAVIRTATHIELSSEDTSAPRLLTPPVVAAPVSRSERPLPQIITPAAAPSQRAAPAKELPQVDQPARPITGNSLRFRLLK